MLSSDRMPAKPTSRARLRGSSLSIHRRCLALPHPTAAPSVRTSHRAEDTETTGTANPSGGGVVPQLERKDAETIKRGSATVEPGALDEAGKNEREAGVGLGTGANVIEVGGTVRDQGRDQGPEKGITLRPRGEGRNARGREIARRDPKATTRGTVGGRVNTDRARARGKARRIARGDADERRRRRGRPR